jgi:ABC-type multidrug transport system fused ATPase/permease subunit
MMRFAPSLPRVYRVFGRHYRDHWKPLALAYLGLVLSVLVALLSPWPLKLILDHVILRNPLPGWMASVGNAVGNDAGQLLLALVGAYLVLRTAETGFAYMHQVGFLGAAARMLTDIRERIFARVQRLSLAFHDSSRSGDLVYRLTADLHDLKILLVEVPQHAVHRLVTIVSHVGLMLALEWRLALVAFSVIPILYLVQGRIGSGVKEATKDKKRKESDVSSAIAENVTAMALVQAYGREDLQRARFESENRQSLAYGIAALRLSKAFRRATDVVIALGTAGVLYYGGMLALEGTILPGSLVLFVAYLKNLYKPIETFANMMLEIRQAQVGGERLLQLLESDMVVDDAADAVVAPPLSGRVEFRNVTFGYRPDVPVLKDVSFVVEPGETIALVGPSGAGKSTLIGLLLRFHDPHQGSILVDGEDVRRFTRASLRSQMTVVLQDAKLFNTTVRDNIAFGKPDSSEEEVVRAARLAQADEFIQRLPAAYETMVSEGGENFSGGERQRVNIARAIIRDTPIVVLDEPATALDARAEVRVHDAVRALTTKKTTFVIAHSVSSLLDPGKILVLKEGRVAAYGKHEELLPPAAGCGEGN